MRTGTDPNNNNFNALFCIAVGKGPGKVKSSRVSSRSLPFSDRFLTHPPGVRMVTGGGAGLLAGCLRADRMHVDPVPEIRNLKSNVLVGRSRHQGQTIFYRVGDAAGGFSVLATSTLFRTISRAVLSSLPPLHAPGVCRRSSSQARVAAHTDRAISARGYLAPTPSRMSGACNRRNHCNHPIRSGAMPDAPLDPSVHDSPMHDSPMHVS